MLEDILKKNDLSKAEIVQLLSLEGEQKTKLFKYASQVRDKFVKNRVYLRGLIEFSNYCYKDCYYCGIRKSNKNVIRFNLDDKSILNAARYALDNRFGSIVLQSGELSGLNFRQRISNLLMEIQEMSEGKLRITLSCGEQDEETYQEWFDQGATRYLLRIETSNKDLYYKLHPEDQRHSFENRLNCLRTLKAIGYQLGTGVMIGLPYQTVDDLADDVIWMKSMNVDMVGMGPYLEHVDTPLYDLKEALWPAEQRFEMALKMIAVLRIFLKNINIAASTALQSIDKIGREKGIKVGANVFMPNITPGQFRDHYKLYDNKPCTSENPEDCAGCINVRISLTGNEIAYDEWGDSLHYIADLNE
jgi:biotin synthase